MRKSKSSENSRIVFHTWGRENLRYEAKLFLDHYDFSFPVHDINDVLELYSVYTILKSDSLNENEQDKLRQLFSIVAKFFKNIDDDHFSEYHQSVLFEYYDDFLSLFEHFKAYENVSADGFGKIFMQEGFTLYKILEHREIVTHYDEILSKYMLSSNQTAEILIHYYLEKRPTKSKPCYLPKSLDKSEYNRIFIQYIDRDFPHIALVNLISYSQSSNECPLSDELRQRAKHRAQELFDNVAVKTSYSYGLGVRFDDIADLKCESEPEPGHILITYDVNWLKDNTDFKSILYNFIHLFSFTDPYMRCKFPAVETQMGIIERMMGVKGIKEYKTYKRFHDINQCAVAEIALYSDLLSRSNIYLENFIQDFFCKYLPEEFSVYGFDVNIPPHTYSYLDKCRLLPIEMERVLKLFRMYVQKGFIDRELYEMSSSPVVFREIPSFINDKYAYANGTDIVEEMLLCFSDQSTLSYIEKYCEKSNYRSFVQLVISNHIKFEEYPDYNQPNLEWLLNREMIKLSGDGEIILNMERAVILKDLYENEVIRTSKYANSKQLMTLIDNKDLIVESTLFSRLEQKFLNYMLNKSEYSNGKDLRNKYIHGTYSQDKKKHFNDYLDLLRIMIVVIIKINEEFCFWCDSQ